MGAAASSIPNAADIFPERVKQASSVDQWLEATDIHDLGQAKGEISRIRKIA